MTEVHPVTTRTPHPSGRGGSENPRSSSEAPAFRPGCNGVHEPVLARETLAYLNLRPGDHCIDATADGGGHAMAILKAIQPGGKLLAIEWDDELFGKLVQRFKRECTPFNKNYALRQASYTRLAELARTLSFIPVAGVLFDLGLSSFHLEASRRGFSFQRDEPLDMRYSRAVPETAADILASRSRTELEEILKNFGEERFSRKIAERIAEERRGRPIRRTDELVAVIHGAVPSWYRRGRIHFATKTFQALRIAVNRELENIPRGLAAAAEVLSPGGRIVVISFHSLEDRLVKQFFREGGRRSRFRPLLKKPLQPGAREILLNPRARSAKLRAFEKLP